MGINSVIVGVKWFGKNRKSQCKLTKFTLLVNKEIVQSGTEIGMRGLLKEQKTVQPCTQLVRASVVKLKL